MFEKKIIKRLIWFFFPFTICATHAKLFVLQCGSSTDGFCFIVTTRNWNRVNARWARNLFVTKFHRLWPDDVRHGMIWSLTNNAKSQTRRRTVAIVVQRGGWVRGTAKIMISLNNIYRRVRTRSILKFRSRLPRRREIRFENKLQATVEATEIHNYPI